MSNGRLNAFNDLKNHAWYGRQMQRLRASDIRLALDRLAEIADLPRDEYVLRVNRLFIGEKPTTKHHLIAEMLLTLKDRI